MNIKLFPILLVLLEVTIYLSNDMYLPALPQLMQNLNIDADTAQLTLTSWFLGGVSLSLILGPISDYYGRRPVVLLGGAIYVIFTVVCALTSNIQVLLLARFLEGTTQCSVVVAGYAAIHELFETKQAIRILALMGSIVIIAPGLGPLAGSLVLLMGTWRTIFWVLAIAAAILIVLLYRFMPESNPHIKAYPLALKATMKSYGEIIKKLSFTLRTLIFCFLFSVFITWITGGPFIVISGLHKSGVSFGIIQFFVFSCFVLGVRCVNPLMERLGINGLVHTGLAIAYFGILLAWILTFNPQNLIGMVIGMMIFSFGGSLAFAPLNRLAMEASPEPMGAKMALFSTAMTSFGAIGSGLVSIFSINNLFSMTSLNLILLSVAGLLTLSAARGGISKLVSKPLL